MSAINQAITTQPAVQSWLRERLEDAVQRVMQSADLSESAAVQSDLEADFRHAFPALVEAIHQLTSQSGRLVIDWDPAAPQRSAVALRFDAPFEIDVFRNLQSLDHEEIDSLLNQLGSLLPDTEPFRGHPHRLGAILLYNAVPLPFQLFAQTHEAHHTRSLKFVPANAQSVPRVAFADGPAAIAEYFRTFAPK